MPPLPLPSSFDNIAGEPLSPNPSYPIDGSNERIARLRTELQGVRTGIQRIVSGLQDLNETTHQQELAAHAALPPFNMSTRSTERSPPRGSRTIFQGNLEASAWSNIPSPARFHTPPSTASTARNPPRVDAARPRPGGQDPMLRVRQRAYLESDQQRQTTVPSLTGNDTAARNPHQRPLRENPFQALGTREEAERPDYQSPVANMYGNAWGEHRNAEAARQVQNSGPPNGLSTIENRPPNIPNPLINPPAMPQYNPPYFGHQNMNGAPPYLHPIGLQGTIPPDLTPSVRYPPRDTPVGPPPRWSFHHLAPTTSNRRQQNLSAPDRGAGNSDTTPAIRRTSDANRRATLRGETEGGAFLRSLEFTGGDMIAARTGYPYVLPGGLHRDLYPARESGSDSESGPALTFDSQDRPPPMDPDSMMLDMACSICKEHLIDTVVLPCGHAVMCNWCADIHVPTRKQDKSTPKHGSAKCPMCRSRIKHKVRFHSMPSLDTNTDGNSSKSFIHEAGSTLRVQGVACYSNEWDTAILSNTLALLGWSL